VCVCVCVCVYACVRRCVGDTGFLSLKLVSARNSSRVKLFTGLLRNARTGMAILLINCRFRLGNKSLANPPGAEKGRTERVIDNKSSYESTNSRTIRDMRCVSKIAALFLSPSIYL